MIKPTTSHVTIAKLSTPGPKHFHFSLGDSSYWASVPPAKPVRSLRGKSARGANGPTDTRTAADPIEMLRGTAVFMSGGLGS